MTNDQLPRWQTLLALLAVLALTGAGLFVVLRPGPAGAPVTGQHSTRSPAVPGPTRPTGSPSPGGFFDPTIDALRELRRLRSHAQHLASRGWQPTRFVVSSFNLLGFSHTVPGGNRKGWAGGRMRMKAAVQHLRRHDVSVAGLQEFQVPQYQVLRRLAPEYAVYPGLRGPVRTAVQNSIIWRRAEWRLQDSGTVSIPYFHGKRTPMPYVLLRNRHTGRSIWFANFHNPADVHGPAQNYRVAATAIEAQLFRILSRRAPLIVTGDMNERSSYACRLLAQVPMHSANGARPGRCQPVGRAYVDWILGSGDVAFPGGLLPDHSVQRGVSDHPMMVARVRIRPSR